MCAPEKWPGLQLKLAPDINDLVSLSCLMEMHPLHLHKGPDVPGAGRTSLVWLLQVARRFQHLDQTRPDMESIECN